MSSSWLCRAVSSPLFIFRKVSVSCLVAVALACTGCLLAPSLQAQVAAHFSYGQRAIVGGLLSPFGVAVDTNGNVYIADSGNLRVLKETLQSDGSYQQSVVASSAKGGLQDPLAVAVDSSGNVYIADNVLDEVLKETLQTNGSYLQSVLASNANVGLQMPVGVAVDSSGNVYIADEISNMVVEMKAAGGVSYPVVGVVVAGVAVDAQGNVLYINDNYPQTLVSTAGWQITLPSDLVSFMNPVGIAVDASGNIYVGNSNTQVVEEIASGGGYTQSMIGSGLSTPSGVAVDASGNVYIADAGNNQVLKVQFSGINLGTTQVGSTGGSATMVFTFDQGGSISKPAVLTQGSPNLDFAAALTQPSNACAAGNYNTGASCAVNVEFSPVAASARYGAVLLSDTSSPPNPIATAYVYGTGLGPQVAFSPYQILSLGGGFSSDAWVTVDAAGNVYVADTFSGVVDMMPPNCPSSSCVTQLGGGFSYPLSIALDGAGNVYELDGEGGPVYEISAGCTTTLYNNGQCAVTQLLGYGDGQAAITVDGTGKLYVVGGNSVLEIPPATSGLPLVSFSPYYAGDFSSVTVDGSGNIYLTDSYYHVVWYVPAGCFSSSCMSKLGSFSSPTDVAVDGAGNVYVTDMGAPAVYEMPPGCTASSCMTTLLDPTTLSTFAPPNSVAVDGSGNVYVTSFASTVTEINRVTPPSLSFATTAPGQRSSDSPQTVTVQNIGNQTLNISAVNSTTTTIGQSVNSFPLDGTTTCTNTTQLANNQGCLLNVDFIPQASGALQGAAIVTDNSLNAAAPNNQQPIALSGTGLQMILSPTSLLNAQVGQSYSVQFTASGGTPSYAYALSGISSVPAGLTSLPPGLTLAASGTGAGTLSGTPVWAGTVNFMVTATDSLGNTVSKSYSLTINQAKPTVSLSSSSNPAFTKNAITFTATAGLAAGVPVATGTMTFLDGETPLCSNVAASASGTWSCTVPSLTATSHSITANYSGDSNFVPGSAALTESVGDFSITGPSATVTVIPGGNGSFIITVTPSGTTTFPGPITLSASNLPANATASFSPSATVNSGSGATVTMSVQTAALSAVRPASGGPHRLAPLSLALLLFPFAGLLRRARRRLLPLLMLAVALAAVMGLSSCSSGTGFFGPAPQSYTITVTGTAGTASNLTHSVNVYLTVE